MIFSVVVILLVAGDLFFWWWGDRQLRPLRKAAVWRSLLAVLLGGVFLMLAWWVLFPRTLRGLGSGFWKPVSAWLYMWHLLVLPITLVAMLFGYSVYWLGNLFKRLAGQAPVAAALPAVDPVVSGAGEARLGSVTGPAVVYPTRRQVLKAAAVFAPQAMLGAALLESARQHGKFRVRRMDVWLPQLPVALDGVTIAHVSDTHVGRFVGPKELDAIVEATANLRPDLIAFTGDLIDFNLADLPPALAAMRQLQKVAPLAMCVGNHDLFEDPTKFRTRVRKAELNLIVDESMPLTLRGQRIDLMGLGWGTPQQPRTSAIDEHMQSVLAKGRADAFRILLAHHPHAFDPAAAAGIPLTLSGHTHGGQIMFTPNWGFGRAYRYWSGLYEKGPAKLVVSNGVGNWFPLRIGAPAEIALLTLRQG
jgi:predicted MPP superfamily phosphohydrolase